MEVRELGLIGAFGVAFVLGDAGLDLVEKEDRVSPRAAKDIRTAGPASESSAARRLFLQSLGITMAWCTAEIKARV